jgi:hypothetical protein
MKMIKKQAMEYINGLMGEFTRDIGSRENNMVSEFSRIPIKKR